MKKKVIIIGIIVLLIISVFSGCIETDNDKENNTADNNNGKDTDENDNTENKNTLFSDGDGSISDPYQIENWSMLQNINYNKSTLSMSYILIDNLDENTEGYIKYASKSANGGAGWVSIGNCTRKFTGTFNGQNYTISNLYINRSNENCVGLFGCTEDGAEIKNLGLIEADITGNGEVGGILGYNDHNVSNCYATGIVNGFFGVGGLVGKNYEGNISNCYSTAKVIGDDSVGGLLGLNEGNGIVKNCYSVGNVTGNEDVGGLVGYNYYSTILDSFWNTDTSNTEFGVGQGSFSDVQNKNTSEMKNITTYSDAGWDIASIGKWISEIWYIDDGNDCPRLGGQHQDF